VNIQVVSNVGRDILQSAQLFRTPEAAVWEYVVNSLQYVEQGVVPNVQVLVDAKAKTITIADNGSGMGFTDLNHYFTMHGENQARRKGVPGRGKFGTGKSAAFGIGTTLTLSTTKAGKRQVVTLDRASIDAAEGSSVPVEVLEQDADAAGEQNGTTIKISGITAKVAKEPIVALIERHLSAFQGSPTVTVNGRVCEIVRPVAVLSRSFTPTAEQAQVLGDIQLTVSAATTPLDDIHRGVQITIGADNLIAVETAGVDSKEFGRQLFGQVDCPQLDDQKYDPVAAYTNDRSMKLNKAHPVALALTTFIGASLEQVRQELVDEGRKAKADADARRLKKTTDKIADVLNDDLKEFSERLEDLAGTSRRRTSMKGEAGGHEESTTEHVVDPAGTDAGEEDGVSGENRGPETSGEGGNEGGEGGEPGGENASPAATPDPDGQETIAPASTGRSRMRGGLNVTYADHGEDRDRSYWDKDTRTIFINRDHPVVKAARALPDDEASFRRLTFEIAFTTYAIALADLQFERDPALSSSDATYEIRNALERVWANAGSLYAV
jgi:hypothetical protein